MAGIRFKRIKAEKNKSVLRRTQEAEEVEQFGRLFYTLLFGFFAGILGMVLKKEDFLYNTGFLDSYTLSPVKFLEPDIGGLLQNILLQRLGTAVVLVILSTTYLGCAAAYLYQVWNGLALGIFVSGSMIRYGMKGFLLFAGSLLPQQLIFIPAFLLLSARCCELCKIMYFRGLSAGFSGKDRYRILLNKGIHIGVVILAILIGCMLETYVNPKMLKFILNFF